MTTSAYTSRDMNRLLLPLVAFVALMAIGCSSTTTQVYDVQVRNETDKPITIWLTKDAPPAEAGWRAPEDIAVSAPGHEERIGGMVVPPGKTAYTGEVKGKFIQHSFAWLRVYDGQYSSFSDLLAVSPRSMSRVDHALDPGKNLLAVRKTNGKLEVISEGQKVTPTAR